MPELPEVETVLRGIRPVLLGKKVIQTKLHRENLRFDIPQAVKQLRGKILNIKRRSKYLLLTFNRGTLIIHLGMSGRLILVQASVPYKKHDHVELILENGISLRFNDQRRFGAFLWTEDDPNNHPLINKIGPEPLSTSFSTKYLFEKTRNRNVCIKTFLMDSHKVAGIGNIYATESLFLAKILPQKKAKDLTYSQAEKLTAAIKVVLKRAIKSGGTTLKDFLNPEGKAGYFSQTLNAYGRAGEPCLVCKTLMKNIRINGRSTVYCPRCQKP